VVPAQRGVGPAADEAVEHEFEDGDLVGRFLAWRIFTPEKIATRCC
jgi:hypothetical protein